MDSEIESLLHRLSKSMAIEKVLSSRSREVVVRATVDGRDCAVRAFIGRGESAIAEWEALTGIRSDRICALVRADALSDPSVDSALRDHAPGVWVARTWIDGQRLDTFAQGATPDAMRQVAADAFEALETVHASGFVHGDLSPGNLIVNGEGRAYLTDFGLATPTGGNPSHARRRSGTPLFMAPEVLAGAHGTAASDLFSMAAVLAICLGGVEVDASRFYGRFPAEPFLDAAGIELGALPEWSRWLLSTLLTRESPEREGGPVSWSRFLRADNAPGEADAASIHVPPLGVLEGREEALSEEELGDASLVIVSTGDNGESSAAVEAAAVLRLRQGRVARKLELPELTRRISNTLELDHSLATELGTLRSGLHSTARNRPTLFAALMADDAWSLEVFDHLGHAVAAAGDVNVVVFVEEHLMGRLGRADSPWRKATRRALPGLTSQILYGALGARLELSQGPVEWVEALDRAARGSVGEVNRLLAKASSAGAFERSGDSSGRAVVRSTFRWEGLFIRRGATVPSSFGVGERVLVAALLLHGGDVSRRQLEPIGGPGKLDSWLNSLEAAGWTSEARTGQIRLLGSPPAIADLGLSRDQVASIHRAIQESHTASKSLLPQDRAQQWVHRLGSTRVDDPETTEAVQAEVAELASRGLHATIATGLGRSRALFESARRPLPVPLMADLAVALAQCGDNGQARSLAGLTGRPSCVSEVEGIIEHRAGHLEASSAAFKNAGRPLLARVESAHAALEANNRALFEEHVKAARRLDPTQEVDGARSLIELLSLEATMASRTGEMSRALVLFDESLALAVDDGGPLMIAAVRISRASFARARGDLDACQVEIDEARRHFRSAGFAPGESQAQAMLGVLLKDRGELLEAEQPLLSAIARRERMGARGAAAMTRGTLGILLLERGHLRRAIDHLDRSHRVVAKQGLTSVARLFGAALDLALARVGRTSLGPLPDLEAESPSDPRVELWHAQASSLRAGELVPTESMCADAQLVVAPPDGGFQSAQFLLETAEARLTSGRDAIAARLGLEAAARARSAGKLVPMGDVDHVEQRSSEVVRTALTRVVAGLDDAERHAAERSLLGIPDPNPAVIDEWNECGDEDMDVMRILELNERLVKQEATPTLLEAIVEAALEVSGAERGFIVMSREGKLAIDTAFESSRGDVGDDDVEFSRSIVEEALTTGLPLRVSDAVEQDGWSGQRSVEDLRLRSILAAPFTVSSILAGVVVVDDRRRPGAFGPREERLLSLLAGQAALALRQVHRLEENRRLAVKLRERIVTREAQLRETQRALTRLGGAAPIEGLIGESHAMEAARSLIHRVARSDISALVTGPSGSGKEVAARAIHGLSGRADRPFVAENCAALPPSLAEAELFGVKKGAFTGADVDRAGLFERADGGTLFLDEVGELPLDLQAKLLRVLETRTIRRIGDEAERSVNFRIVSATNRTLRAEAEAGRFRADLMYRLDGVTVEMPSLNDRREDIPALVEHFLSCSAEDGQEPKSMSAAVLSCLMARDWPGNVRELANEVERLVVLSGADISDPQLVRPSSQQSAVSTGGAHVQAAGMVRPIAELERIAIVDALRATGDDKSKAAELLGISRAKIYQRLKEWNQAEQG